MSQELLKMLTGRVTSSGPMWKQISATGSIAEPVYAFIPVGGNVTFTAIQEGGADASANNASGTYYEGQLYPGRYTLLTLATGTILCYLGKS